MSQETPLYQWGVLRTSNSDQRMSQENLLSVGNPLDTNFCPQNIPGNPLLSVGIALLLVGNPLLSVGNPLDPNLCPENIRGNPVSEESPEYQLLSSEYPGKSP